MPRIQPYTRDDLSSAEHTASKEGRLYDTKDEAIAHARLSNQYRQTQAAKAAVSQSRNGFWFVHEPGTLLISDLLSRSKTAEVVE